MNSFCNFIETITVTHSQCDSNLVVPSRGPLSIEPTALHSVEDKVIKKEKEIRFQMKTHWMKIIKIKAGKE